MNENPPENSIEKIPTAQEVLGVFMALVGGAKFETTRKIEDDKGLYLFEIKIPAPDGHTEYLYRREDVRAAEELQGRVDVAYYDIEDYPVSGSSVAKNTDGEWRLTP